MSRWLVVFGEAIARRLMVAAVAAAGCGGSRARQAPRSARLGEGIVATVGAEPIDVATVSAIARAQAMTPQAARDAAVFDALLAGGARRDLPGEASSAEARVLARALLHRIWAEAQAAPIRDDELADRTTLHFMQVDRPPGFRVIHAVVLVAATAAKSEQERARAHAEAIRAVIAPLARIAAAEPPPPRSGDDVFLERPGIPEDPIAVSMRRAVGAMDHDKLDVRIESLGVISEDGRYLNYDRSPFDRLVESFSHTAAALQNRGDVSPVVETDLMVPPTRPGDKAKEFHGYHVIVLLERTPELRHSRAERLAELGAEILRVRARKAERDLLAALGNAAHVTIARNADSLLDGLRAATEAGDSAASAAGDVGR